MAESSFAFSVTSEGGTESLVEREWLLTNGLGGFAAGALAGVNIRRYHGLLVAATLPPVGRIMTVARTVDLLWIDGRRFDFSAALFGDKLVGDGPALLERFDLADELATWEYEIEGVRVQRQLLLCWGRNATGIRYRIVPGSRQARSQIRLGVVPLVALRDFHGLRRHRGADLAAVAIGPTAVTVHDGEHSVLIEAEAARFTPRPHWWYGHTYPRESERGLDDTEDLLAPGEFQVACAAGTETVAAFWIHTGAVAGGYAWDQEAEQRRRALAPPAMKSPAQRRLARSAADFVVERTSRDGKSGKSIIAGYPWFADWGRDTFISLPGLLLCTGRFEEARQVLFTYAGHVSEGMIPNRFDDYTGEPQYNTVDASLWFIHAAHEYARLSGDVQTLGRTLRPACEAIVDGYTRGTRYGIHVDPADGLVTAGDQSTQLTWMDAKRDGVVFTPRHGKAVEINALWYNALALLGLEERAERVRQSFAACFCGGEAGGLFDVVNEQGRDGSIRPNQIFAVSLPHSPLSTDQQRAVVSVVRKHLLTPYGLRTLAPGDPMYCPRFEGPLRDRDRAYHNGTVWPWLIGPFIDAWLRVNEYSVESVALARGWLAPLLDHFERDGCLGSISEVFDGDSPHRPAGCFAQAWSVAEVLRLAVELDL